MRKQREVKLPKPQKQRKQTKREIRNRLENLITLGKMADLDDISRASGLDVPTLFPHLFEMGYVRVRGRRPRSAQEDLFLDHIKQGTYQLDDLIKRMRKM